MNWKRKLAILPIPWFTLAMIGIFFLSLGLRFWKLSQFNVFVFDEVYYAKFANDYLTGNPFFNAHPPLSQYIIAIGIWLGSFFPAEPDTINSLTGSLRSTFSYRWFNAITGSFIPLVVGAIAYQLNHRRRYSLIAALFVATDGLFLVESRYALNNIYLVILGLLGQLFFLWYINNQSSQYWLLILSGIFFGATASIKWNGLWFLLGIYLLLGFAFVHKLITTNSEKKIDLLQKISSIKIYNIFLGFLIVPVATYSLIWIPHLIMNPNYNFWEMQQQIFAYHQRIGDGTSVHPYCSHWYSWLLMWRPIAYFYENKSSNIIYDVHAMGNPILWWLSTVAIVLIILLTVMGIFPKIRKKYSINYGNYNPSIGIYLTCNYLANLLPWIKVTRCTFIYHYMGAYIFAMLALAWMVDQWLNNSSSNYQKLGIMTISLIIVAFIYWLPIYLGIPLSQQGYQIRMLFPNWI